MFEHKFFGLAIFKYEDCEYDNETTVFENVEFCPPSLQKFNGNYASLSNDGTLVIHDEEGSILWEGYITDICEWEDMYKSIKYKGGFGD